jgi:hypothetical protein
MKFSIPLQQLSNHSENKKNTHFDTLLPKAADSGYCGRRHYLRAVRIYGVCFQVDKLPVGRACYVHELPCDGALLRYVGAQFARTEYYM